MQLTMIERNITTLGKMLTGPDKASVISGLRSKVSSLRNRGESFSPKAAPLEKECQALVSEYKKLDALKKERDRKLAAIQTKLDANLAEFKRDIPPREHALSEELASLKSQNCARGIMDRTNDLYKQCHGLEMAWIARDRAMRQDRDVYKRKYEQLIAQKKVVSKPYTQSLNKYRAHYNSYMQELDRYHTERKKWSNDMFQVLARTNQLYMQAQKARKQVVRQTPEKHRGGQLGKLSGSFDKGNPGRSPGSGKLPGSATIEGEGGAKGQARTAANSGGHGASSGNAAGAAFQAGRVFDRGDVKVSGKPSVFKARGMKERAVPDSVRQNPRWQVLERQGKEYRVEQEKAQKRVDAIKQKLQAGEGDKGKLQVELVHARDAKTKIDSKVYVNKVEKESFVISIEKKIAKQSKNSTGNHGGGK